MKNKKKVYFISGGGTGGHIYPALAIIKELQKTEADIYYVGNPKNPEYKIAKENNIKFTRLNFLGNKIISCDYHFINIHLKI